MWVILLQKGLEVDEVAFQDPFLEGVVPQKEPLKVRQDQGEEVPVEISMLLQKVPVDQGTEFFHNW